MISAEKKMLLAQQVEAIARKAGKWMAGHKISQVTTKGGVSNVVTDIDIQCQRLIIEECTRCLPESVILAEEENRLAEEARRAEEAREEEDREQPLE